MDNNLVDELEKFQEKSKEAQENQLQAYLFTYHYGPGTRVTKETELGDVPYALVTVAQFWSKVDEEGLIPVFYFAACESNPNIGEWVAEIDLITGSGGWSVREAK